MILVILQLFLEVLIDVLDLQLKRPRTSQYRVISPTTASGTPVDSDPEREYDTLHHGLDPDSTNNVSYNCATFR